ncbi:MAG: hypothetical protein IPN88_18545 [Bacteroidetes bacterium]|nr:hypothetical protein [Bacteroidota bacterium]
MIDATQGLNAQDLAIFRLIEKNNKGVVFIINKWDLVEEKTSLSTKEYTDKILAKTAPWTDIPILFTSVHEKQRVHRPLEVAVQVYEKSKDQDFRIERLLFPLIERYSAGNCKK